MSSGAGCARPSVYTRTMFGPFSDSSHVCSGRITNSYASGSASIRGQPAGVPQIEIGSGNRSAAIRCEILQ